MRTEESRAAFELWVMRNARPGTHLQRSHTGVYKDNRVAAKWAAWVAALDWKQASVPARA